MQRRSEGAQTTGGGTDDLRMQRRSDLLHIVIHEDCYMSSPFRRFIVLRERGGKGGRGIATGNVCVRRRRGGKGRVHPPCRREGGRGGTESIIVWRGHTSAPSPLPPPEGGDGVEGVSEGADITIMPPLPPLPPRLPPRRGSECPLLAGIYCMYTAEV